MLCLRSCQGNFCLVTVDAQPAPAGPSEREVASAINGLVVCSATLVASSISDRLTYVATATLATGVVFWVSESYAHAYARRAVKKAALSLDDVRAILNQEWPMVSATFVPLAVMLLAGALGRSVSTSVDVALGVAIVLLAVAGWRASFASAVRGPRLFAAAALAAQLGVAMALLKAYVLH